MEINEIKERVFDSLVDAAICCETTVTVKKKQFGGIEETTTVTRRLPPDVDACIFLLTNADPETWKNRREERLAIMAKVNAASKVLHVGDDAGKH